MKIGYEVEGRLKGLYTLFMDGEEAKEFFDFPSLRKRAEPEIPPNILELVRHIYISDIYGVIKPDAECLVKWALMGMMITIETRSVAPHTRFRYPECVGIMFNVGDAYSNKVMDSFLELKDTDQIKFSHDNYVWCVTKENMTKTAPLDFMGDFEFTALRPGKDDDDLPL